MRYTPEDATEVGDRVLVEVRRTGRGSASGAQVDERQFHVWDVLADRAVRFRVYLDHDQALKAIGLRGVGRAAAFETPIRRAISERH